MRTQFLCRLIFAIGVGLCQTNCQLVTDTRDLESLAQKLDADVVRIPAGEFIMGSDNARSDERPQHRVYLDTFEIDRYEVTNAQYRRFALAIGRTPPQYWNGFDFPTGQTDMPVVGVSWDDADTYCQWVGKRLPTEAEWEKACRGTDGRVYPWGDDWNAARANVATPNVLRTWDDAWILLRSTNTQALKPIGSFASGASPYGVMDLVGNASEWILDWYNWRDYSDVSNRNPLVTAPPWNHNVRGSAWFDLYGDREWAQQQSRCSARNSSHETADPRTGFRCARTIE